MSTRTRSRVRSISTEEMPARSRVLVSMARILMSSPMYSLYDFSVNQRLRWSVLMPRRKPYGWIFWPMCSGSLLGRALGLDDDGDVAGTLEDAAGAPLGPRADATHGHALVHERRRDEQVVTTQ